MHSLRLQCVGARPHTVLAEDAREAHLQEDIAYVLMPDMIGPLQPIEKRLASSTIVVHDCVFCTNFVVCGSVENPHLITGAQSESGSVHVAA